MFDRDKEQKNQDLQDKDKEKKDELNPQVLQMQKKLLEMEQNFQALQSDLSQRDEEIKKLKSEEDNRLMESSRLKSLLGNDKEEKKDLDELSNKELINVIADAMETALESRMKMAESSVIKRIEETDNSLKTIKDAMINQFRLGRLNKVMETYQDFEQLKPDIAEILNSNPSIDPEQAYFMAKGKRFANSPDRRQLESERPDYFASNRSGLDEFEDMREDYDNRRESRSRQREDESSSPRGSRASFRDILTKGIDNAISRRSRQ